VFCNIVVLLLQVIIMFEVTIVNSSFFVGCGHLWVAIVSFPIYF
jgi:hypothetical protein